jgi:5'-nucleotidase / UDP-sugar diphosphatase
MPPTRLRPFVIASIPWAAALVLAGAVHAETVSILHVGDQESWLVSAQGNLRDNSSQGLSFYGGVDRMASVMARAQADAQAAGHFVLKLNAGDAFLPGPRWNASKINLGSAFTDGGQDYYDAIAMRHIGFHGAVFGNHEFDEGPGTAARFAQVSGTTYLSSNLDFSGTPEFASLAASGTVAPFKLVTTTNGHRIALVGATTPLLPRISSPGGIGLLGYDPAASDEQNLISLASTIQSRVDMARAAGAGTVVLMSHLQNWNNERNVVIPRLTGVDVVLSGGGHELMADADDALLPGGVRDITGMPQIVNDAAGRGVAVVTSNFGNRYVGQLTVTLDDATGQLSAINGSAMHRVSGNLADADRVVGDATLKAGVVDPVLSYIGVLNATQIGSSEVLLLGQRGSAGAPGSFVAGVRNAETNLGNLLADSLRFAAGTDVAVQNGGGIRADIAAGPVTEGDTFNVAPFTNLVRRANVVDAAQLKSILEHSYATASPSGAVNGRFAQIAGMTVTYDTRAASGARVQRIVLDDGTVLVDGGAVVNVQRTVSLATIDFLAGGGDGYPFAANGVTFENAVNSVTYQEALSRYISAAGTDGGLDGVVRADRYGTNSPFDFAGRQVDLAIAVPEPETYALMLGGLLLLGAWTRRQRASSRPS